MEQTFQSLAEPPPPLTNRISWSCYPPQWLKMHLEAILSQDAAFSIFRFSISPCPCLASPALGSLGFGFAQAPPTVKLSIAQ
jgi:hypothetical protein